MLTADTDMKSLAAGKDVEFTFSLISHWSISVCQECIFKVKNSLSLCISYCLFCKIIVHCISVCCFDTSLELWCRFCHHCVCHVIAKNGFLCFRTSLGALIMNYGSVQLSIFFVFVFNTEKKF
jgi:hypothetical protein